MLLNYYHILTKMKLYLILLVFIMLIDQSVHGGTIFKVNYFGEITNDDLDQEINEIKKVIQKGNYASYILELTELITYEKLQDLKNIKDINLFIESYNTYNKVNNIITSNLKTLVNHEGTYTYSKIIQKLIDYTKTTIYEIEKNNNHQHQIRDFRPAEIYNNIKNIIINSDNSTLNNIKLEKERLVLCSKILEIYSKLKEELDIDNEYYFSKDYNFIFEEIYTVGLQILNYKKDHEKIVESIYNEYGDYCNTLSLLNSYLEKKLI